MRTTISAFSQAAEQAQHWVNELADELGCDEHQAYRVLRAVLHTLRDFLSPEEAADLSAQLPLLIRGIYFEGWTPSTSPLWERSKADFLGIVADRFGSTAPNDLVTVVGAAFALIDRHISQGESIQVRNSLKKSLRQLWPVH